MNSTASIIVATVIACLCGFSGAGSSQDIPASQQEKVKGKEKEAGAKAKTDDGKKDAKKRTFPQEAEAGGRPVMWEEPGDLEGRDLFYGLGGQKGAPDPAGKFTFIERDPGGTSEKIVVEDDKGRKWKVKFGAEARPETSASRIVWAAGYHVDQDYFVKRTHIEGRGGFDVWDVRFERDDDGYKKVGPWAWRSNPFQGTRELDGLKTLMALLNNFDVKAENNRVVRPGKKSGDDPAKLIYYVGDLGATLGSTGFFLTQIPLFGEMPAGTKGNPHHFAAHPFIERVANGEVTFHNKRRRSGRDLAGVKVENARWMGGVLNRLSDKQLSDAFRAGGFDEAETAIYVRAMRDRISQLLNLK
ncbi:MAG TPA: hypothetical protein VJH03_00685 [Blastocatellia bacterium]|nr:hypothetical protein [Blastocatellia bacterium]